MNAARPRSKIRAFLRRCAIAAGLAVAAIVAVAAVVWHASPFPIDRLERRPTSPRVTARDGSTLLAVVGRDDQWRLPVPLGRMSPRLIDATVAVEDARFRSHRGVDPLAVVRAAGRNLTAGRIVSGASTITMQVCRMIDDRPRSWRSKVIEAFRALQLERLRDKDTILEAYLNIAPYGGNIRGVEAASLACFDKHATDLSLAEAALLAGLPQSPSAYRPDRHSDAARRRRNVVLAWMVERGTISQAQYDIASAEPVLLSRHRPADLAPHAANLALQRRPNGGQTTIDPAIQREATRLAVEYVGTLPPGSDVTVVVIDIARSDIVAMVGSCDAGNPVDGQINGAMARRSPGSALKPFIYAAAFETRLLNDQSIVYDVPIHRAGWSPTNFDGRFAGELTVAEALRRSLNVPAILVAEAVGLTRCLGQIEAVGIRLPKDAAERGGLAVVVGAIEVSLLDLVNGYATLGRGGIRATPRLFVDEPVDGVRVLSSDTCRLLDDILSSRRRIPHARDDGAYRDIPWFMWKTGTSSGRRDAWAAGHNGRFAAGVWVGRFSGVGSEAYVGAEAAEPMLARLFMVPGMRNDTDPGLPVRWPAKTVLHCSENDTAPLRILKPHDGGAFVAVGGRAVIHPCVNRASDRMVWFLNGALLSTADANRLVLGVGSYELRCVEESTGAMSAIRFTVCSEALSFAGSDRGSGR